MSKLNYIFVFESLEWVVECACKFSFIDCRRKNEGMEREKNYDEIVVFANFFIQFNISMSWMIELLAINKAKFILCCICTLAHCCLVV